MLIDADYLLIKVYINKLDKKLQLPTTLYLIYEQFASPPRPISRFK